MFDKEEVKETLSEGFDGFLVAMICFVLTLPLCLGFAFPVSYLWDWVAVARLGLPALSFWTVFMAVTSFSSINIAVDNLGTGQVFTRFRDVFGRIILVNIMIFGPIQALHHFLPM